MTRLDPLKEEPTHGSVISSMEDRLSISFEEKFELSDGPWRYVGMSFDRIAPHWLGRLDIWQSSIAYKRMREAVGFLNNDPDKVPVHHGYEDSDREVMQRGTFLRDILLRSYAPKESTEDRDKEFSPDKDTSPEIEIVATQDELADTSQESLLPPLDGLFKQDARIQSWAKRYSEPDPLVIEGDPVLQGLNETQVRAIAMMLNNRLTLVQGVSAPHHKH